MPSILKLQNIQKSFVQNNGENSLRVLQDINFSIEKGETCAIVGPSGSGKTTLLGLCAGLDKPTSGRVFLLDHELNNLSEDELARVRNENVGFIFQQFNLLPSLTALENVMVPLELQGAKNAAEQAVQLLEKVGLTERKTHYPAQLSGGEQQRVSIARAFANNPKILFADEPTGNLDETTSAKIEELILKLNQEAGTTLIIVTHNRELAGKTQRIIELKGGQILEDKQLVKEAAKG